MRSTEQNIEYRLKLFFILIGLICLSATFAYLLPGFERVAQATQPTVSSPGSLIFKSDDRGESWTPVGALPDVLALTPDPAGSGTIYAGSSVGLYKSVNSGATWALSANGLPREPVKAIVVDPKNTNIVYAGTSNSSFTGTVYKSADSGANWVKSDTGLAARIVHALAISPSNSDTIFAATASGMFKSVDGGANWVAINNGLTFTAHGGAFPYGIPAVLIDPSNPNVIYAATFSGGGLGPPSLRKSVDGGNSWGLASNSGIYHSLVIDPLNPSTLYGGYNGYGYDSGIAKSTDGGSTWQRVLPD